MQSDVFLDIENQINRLNPQSISAERKLLLEPLIVYIRSKVSKGEEVRLNFICTHNSRRSHLSQIWAQTIASFYGFGKINCYSGGTEATALFPVVIETLRKSGFQITKIAKNDNPVYSIKYADNAHPIIGFSKKLDYDFNPKSKFAAVMTCSQADEGCPFVAGAEVRIPITFEDPKVYDNTPLQAEKYKERSLQIATELLYVFDKVRNDSVEIFE